jgi:hypothetical protein
MTATADTPSPGKETSGTANELHTDTGVARRQFLGAAAAAATLPAVSGPTIAIDDSDAEQDDEIVETPDLRNDYPNTRRLKGGTGQALTGLWCPDQFSSMTRAEMEDVGGVTELEFYQHVLQWGMGISLKIRKGEGERAISLDVDRVRLFGQWLIEASRVRKQWRAENSEACGYEIEKSEKVAGRIDDPAVVRDELRPDRLKSPADLDLTELDVTELIEQHENTD